MKTKLLAYLLGSTVIMMLSCHDDDKGDTRSVEGRWQGTLLEAKIVKLNVDLQTYKDDTFNAILEFKGNGSMTVEDEGTTVTGTWEQQGETLTLNTSFTIEDISLSGNYTVRERSDTKLTLYTEREETYKDPDTGIEVSATAEVTLYFVALP